MVALKSTRFGTLEIRAFLKGLTYGKDHRKPPDGWRRGQFRRGWNQAAAGQSMSQSTLDDRLTWNNLGYRLGMAFGPASAATIDAVFEDLPDLDHRASP